MKTPAFGSAPAGRHILPDRPIRFPGLQPAGDVLNREFVMLFAFAPIVALLLGLSAITMSWATLVISVVRLVGRSRAWYERRLAP
ncbi:MAG: hypothetical protein KGJ99_09425 [Betaproteobacteria bacterium]|nr:hypothetical protein [Betaproteobacteria bacterium]